MGYAKPHQQVINDKQKMSFIHVAGPHYVKRSLIFVNSFDRVKEGSRNGFDFSWALEEELQQVFSIELVQYSFPRTITNTWVGIVDTNNTRRNDGVLELNSTKTNVQTDIRITSEDGLSSIILHSNLDLGIFFPVPATFPNNAVFTFSGQTPEELIPIPGKLSQREVSQFDIEARFALSTDSVLNSTNYTVEWVYLNDVDKANEIQTMIVSNNGPATYATVEFLYGTGANKENQTSRVWGFPPGVDSTPTTEQTPNLNGARPSAPLQFTQFRYMNIYLEEAPEFRPFARIYTTDEIENNYTTPCNLPMRTRILKTPIRRMRRLRFRASLEDDIELLSGSDNGLMFTFEVLSIAQVPKVPAWVIQRLTL